MRVTEDALLRARYDVIVVGAGLGGLTAASLLARRGLGVLLIDQQNKPGGSCTSFKRDDVVFDVGTAMIYGFGKKGFRPFHFVLNELEEPIEVVAHRTLARMTYEGRPIVFWPNLDRFLDELADLFPNDRAALRAFYRDLRKMYEHIVVKNEVIVPPSEFSARQGLRRVLTGPLAMLKMGRLLHTSVQELLDRYALSEEAVCFFDKLCSAYCYCTAAETPAVLAATMFIDNHIGGIYYPAGGAQMLPNKMEKAFERDGGQALYRHLVDEILIRDGAAYGVRLADGTEILGERIIANATVWNLYGKLVRPEHIRPERLAWAQGLVPTFPSMTLYMTVDRTALPADAVPWEIFIENRQVIDSTDLTLYINSLADETLCPKGDLAVLAIAPNMERWPSPQDAGYRSEAYEAQKAREAEKMLDQIERHYPGFRGHIKTLLVGTPTTIERYLLKNGGAVGGPKNAIGQEMLKRLHARSEWPNLYLCGDSTVMATGAPATAVSGVGAANMVLRDLRRREYDARPFPREHVHFVDLPYRRPGVAAGEPLTTDNAHLAAVACQWCEDAPCVAACPAGLDIPGFLRRIEARNYVGAARLIRARNPLGETCGHTCEGAALCELACYRRTFAGAAVRIAALQRCACQAAGEAGWWRPESAPADRLVAVVGGGPAGLTCAHYLALMGHAVDLYDRREEPGGRLRDISAQDEAMAAATRRDLQGAMIEGVIFHGGTALGEGLDLRAILAQARAVYLADELTPPARAHLEATLGRGWLEALASPQARAGLYVSPAVRGERPTVVQEVGDGRRTAVAIGQYLGGA